MTAEVSLEELEFSVFMVEQGKDQECREILNYLRNEKIPEDRD